MEKSSQIGVQGQERVKAVATLVFEQGTRASLSEESAKLGERLAELVETVPAFDDVLQTLQGQVSQLPSTQGHSERFAICELASQAFEVLLNE